MSAPLRCRQCGCEMYSSGLRGICLNCLLICSSHRFGGPATAARAAADDEVLAFDAAVGPDDRFKLLDRLGEGGMGEVWLAEDGLLSQPDKREVFALKFLSKLARHNPVAVAALRKEVLRTHNLTHPHIVRIYDLHRTRSGLPFIKMEFVDGKSLAQNLRARPEGFMPYHLVARLTRQLADALSYAHEKAGIIHRDLKPANLLLARGDNVKLADFGLAQAMRHGAQPGNELVGGTLHYASPQQIDGDDASPADDIYSLGATLYELLTGKPPFFEAESTDELINKIKNDTLVPIPNRLRDLGRRNDAPPKLLALVHRCLEKDPMQRPKASEVAGKLPLIAETLPAQNHPVRQVQVEWRPQPEPEPEPDRSKEPVGWFRAAAITLAICGVIALLAILILDPHHPPPSKTRSPEPSHEISQEPPRSATAAPRPSPPTNPAPFPATEVTPNLLIDARATYTPADRGITKVAGDTKPEPQLTDGKAHKLGTNLPRRNSGVPVTVQELNLVENRIEQQTQPELRADRTNSPAKLTATLEAAVQPEFRLNGILSDNMVLQEDCEIWFSGTSLSKSKMEIFYRDRHASTIANDKGGWQVKLDLRNLNFTNTADLIFTNTTRTSRIGGVRSPWHEITQDKPKRPTGREKSGLVYTNVAVGKVWWLGLNGRDLPGAPRASAPDPRLDHIRFVVLSGLADSTPWLSFGRELGTNAPINPVALEVAIRFAEGGYIGIVQTEPEIISKFGTNNSAKTTRSARRAELKLRPRRDYLNARLLLVQEWYDQQMEHLRKTELLIKAKADGEVLSAVTSSFAPSNHDAFEIRLQADFLPMEKLPKAFWPYANFEGAIW